MKKLLALFGNDIGLVNKYVSLVKVQLPKQLDSLEALIKSGNFSDASAMAHGIKGQCQYLDWENASQAAEYLERLLEGENVTGLLEKSMPLANKLKADLLLVLATL